MTRVLMFSAAFGDGHRQVAAALAEAFQRRGVSVVEEDNFRGTNPWMAEFSQSVYEWTTRYTPVLYGTSYRVTAHIGPDHAFWRWLAVMSRKAALQALQRTQPDAVLQLFPDHALARLPTGWRKPYTAVVLTDYGLHPHWFHPNVDTYFLAADALVEEARQSLAGAAETVATGIPVRPQFRQPQPMPAAVHQPYVVVATGGRGVFAGLSRVLNVLHDRLPEHHIYVMCGRNERMRAHVESLRTARPRITALPFVDNVACWFQFADFALIKSGGATVTECLVSHCPMLIFRPQPGQEEDNARFVARAGAAKLARHWDELEQQVAAMRMPEVRTQMTAACARLARPDAADRIVEHVLSRLAGKPLKEPVGPVDSRTGTGCGSTAEDAWRRSHPHTPLDPHR